MFLDISFLLICLIKLVHFFLLFFLYFNQNIYYFQKSQKKSQKISNITYQILQFFTYNLIILTKNYSIRSSFSQQMQFQKQEKLSVQKFYKDLYFKTEKIKAQMIYHQMEGDQSIFVAGKTGSGKSTLITHAIGFQCEYSQQFGIFKFKPKDVKTNLMIPPQIGHGHESCTQIPGVYINGKKKFVDLAGFQDSKGIQQQILNAFSTSSMFIKSKKIKVIITIAFTELIDQRGKAVQEIVSRLIQVVPKDIQNMMDSFMIVVTKTNQDNSNLEYIIKCLIEIKDKNKNLSPKAQMVLEHIVQNKRVFLFTNPKVGNFDIWKFNQQLKNVKYCKLTRNGNVSLSPQGKQIVVDSLEYLKEYLQKIANQICEHLNRKFKNKNYDIDNKGNDTTQDWNALKNSKQMIQQWTPKLHKITEWHVFVKILKDSMGLTEGMHSQLLRAMTMIQFFTKIKQPEGNQQKFRTGTGFLQTIMNTLIELLRNLELKREKNLSQKQRKQDQKRQKEQINQIKNKFNQEVNKIHQMNAKKLKQLHDQMQQEKIRTKDLINQIINQNEEKKNDQSWMQIILMNIQQKNQRIKKLQQQKEQNKRKKQEDQKNIIWLKNTQNSRNGTIKTVMVSKKPK